MHDVWMIVLYGALVLGVLVFVHELGHFLVAKWLGVRVPPPPLDRSVLTRSPRVSGSASGTVSRRSTDAPPAPCGSSPPRSTTPWARRARRRFPLPSRGEEPGSRSASRAAKPRAWPRSWTGTPVP